MYLLHTYLGNSIGSFLETCCQIKDVNTKRKENWVSSSLTSIYSICIMLTIVSISHLLLTGIHMHGDQDQSIWLVLDSIFH